MTAIVLNIGHSFLLPQGQTLVTRQLLCRTMTGLQCDLLTITEPLPSAESVEFGSDPVIVRMAVFVIFQKKPAVF
jgi:hypothetical protein